MSLAPEGTGMPVVGRTMKEIMEKNDCLWNHPYHCLLVPDHEALVPRMVALHQVLWVQRQVDLCSQASCSPAGGQVLNEDNTL